MEEQSDLKEELAQLNFLGGNGPSKGVLRTTPTNWLRVGKLMRL